MTSGKMTSVESLSNQRWQAVVSRDPMATMFFYAVHSTRIYCRPCCPARLARRANVSFFDTCILAESAGYRPCKRCRPREVKAINTQPQIMDHVCRLIEQGVSESKSFTLSELAKEAGLTLSHFHRSFKKFTGKTPKQYAQNCKKNAMMATPNTMSKAGDLTPLSSGDDAIFTPGEWNIDTLFDATIWTPGFEMFDAAEWVDFGFDDTSRKELEMSSACV